MTVDLKPLRDEGERLVSAPDPKRLSPSLTSEAERVAPQRIQHS